MNAIQFFQWGVRYIDKTTLEFDLSLNDEDKIVSCLFEEVKIKSKNEIFTFYQKYNTEKREQGQYNYSIYTQHEGELDKNDVIDEITFVGTVNFKENVKIKKQENSLFYGRIFDDFLVPPGSSISSLNYTTSVRVISQNKYELNFKFNGLMIKPLFKFFYKNAQEANFSGKII